MVRLYSDLRDGAARRYFYDLDSTPGILQPGAATLTIGGHDPQYPGTIFRTPATITLTLFGRAIGPSGSILSPATAALVFSNSTVGLRTERTIQLTLPSPVEDPPAPFAPTILYINTITPAPAALTLNGFSHSLSEGGNIGFARPEQAALTLFGYQYTRVIPPPPGENLDGVVGTAFMQGLEPSLLTEIAISPVTASLALTQLAPHADRGFLWIDDDPAPQLQWA
jgi:hypothetical protein